MPYAPGILARGPWPAEQVSARWRDDPYEGNADKHAAADEAIEALQDRGSPAHDGYAARLADFEFRPPVLSGSDLRSTSQPPVLSSSDLRSTSLELDLQPMRWSLRLVEGDASGALSVLCVVRDRAGRWLAGRRAPWVATWAGRWALGAGGAVEVGEDPVEALTRELEEEWAIVPDELAVEALVCLPNRLTMLVGQAWLFDDVEVEPDHEHDEFAWWAADPAAWPAEADPALRRMAQLLGP